jgi:hypothetical protein
LIATEGRLFSHIGDARCYCSSLSSPSDTTRSLSAEGHSSSDNNTHFLSSEGQSLDLCAQMSPPTRAVRRRQLLSLRGSRLISLLRKLALQQASRSHARRRKGPRPLRCCRGRDAASDPPPRPRSPRRKSSSRWKLIAPLLLKFFSCPNPLVCYRFFCV